MFLLRWLHSYIEGEKRKIVERELEDRAVKKNHKLMYKRVKWFDGLKK